MKKINFVNGTTIDAANTFNQMQENVEDVFNGNESMGSIVVEDISSKNKFNFNALSTPTGEVDYINKTITVRQFANGTEQTLKQLCPELKAGETYILSFNTTGKSNFIHLFGTSTNWMNGTAHVITQADIDNNIAVYGNFEADADVVISEIQIEKGNRITSYIPYKGFNNKQVYSANEQVIGTWIDGTPIYRKVFQSITPSTTGAMVLITDGLPTFETCVNIYGMVKVPNQDASNWLWVRDCTVDAFYVNLSGRHIVCGVENTDYCEKLIYIIVEYTKGVNTQSVSTMSLRPETTEVEETE